jgi:hypothetical protein
MKPSTFFLLGNPRSGTSVFRLMLNAHKDILVPPECGFLQWWYLKYKDWSVGSNSQSDIESFVEDVRKSRKIETWNLDYSNLKKFIIKDAPKDYGELCLGVYRFFAFQRNRNVKIIGDKNNYYIHHLDDLKKIWASSKFILIIRDGRDVACSYMALNELKSESPYKPKLPKDIRQIAFEWVNNNSNVISFFNTLSEDRYTIVKYEDLMSDPSDVLSKVCLFLNVAFDPKMLDYYLDNLTSLEEPEATLDWKRKTLEKPDVSGIGKYKLGLSNEEVNIFNKMAADLLSQFNYSI